MPKCEEGRKSLALRQKLMNFYQVFGRNTKSSALFVHTFPSSPTDRTVSKCWLGRWVDIWKKGELKNLSSGVGLLL